MGITSITNLVPLQNTRALQAGLDPRPMDRVENSSRIGDETYSPSNGQSARGSEDDAPEDEAGEDGLDDPGDEPIEEPIPSSVQSRPISFFA